MGPFFDSGRDSRPTLARPGPATRGPGHHFLFLASELGRRINITSISDGALGAVDLPQMPVDPRPGSKFGPPDQGRDSAMALYSPGFRSALRVGRLGLG
jgi:hypothetical protein